MFNKIERLISTRNLKPKKKEGFLKVISAFSFLGIMLGVAILIIVMSVMNGFRTDLTNKIVGFNPHIIIEPNNSKITDKFKNDLKKKFKNFKLTSSYSGEGVLMTKENAKGVLFKGIDILNKKNISLVEEKIITGNFEEFSKTSVIIGSELAFDLNLSVNDKINLMSSAFIKTPFGEIPKQESYKVAAIFNTGFYEFDKNVVYLQIDEALSILNKSKDDISLEIYLSDPINADIYKEKIRNINDEYFIYSWTDLNKSFFSALKVERNVMFIILTLIIVVAAFNIISGLTILIKNKTREISILKTLGLSDRSIQKSFFLTGMTIGFFASVTGAILGTLFSIYIENIRQLLSTIFKLEIFPSDVYFLEKMPSEINPLSILIILIFSLLTTAIASYFPAKNISKMQTTKGLKYE